MISRIFALTRPPILPPSVSSLAPALLLSSFFLGHSPFLSPPENSAPIDAYLASCAAFQLDRWRPNETRRERKKEKKKERRRRGRATFRRIDRKVEIANRYDRRTAEGDVRYRSCTKADVLQWRAGREGALLHCNKGRGFLDGVVVGSFNPYYIIAAETYYCNGDASPVGEYAGAPPPPPLRDLRSCGSAFKGDGIFGDLNDLPLVRFHCLLADERRRVPQLIRKEKKKKVLQPFGVYGYCCTRPRWTRSRQSEIIHKYRRAIWPLVAANRKLPANLKSD